VLAVACVSPGRHGEVVDERDALAGENERLAQRVTLLEASNQSLSQERVDLISAVEDLRQEREELAAAVTSLQAAREELEESLRAREEALVVRREELASLRETYDGLVTDLQSEVASGRIQIEQLREGLRVNLSQEILFPLGSAELGAEGRRVLAAVAARLQDLANRVEVQGHTDDLAIHGRLARVYPSNWELGAARAASVVRLFEREGLASDRLVAVSFADTRPVAPNDTPEGRARNRRIEIRLAPSEEPDPAPAGGAPAAAPGKADARSDDAGR
jgi:chemotaxis protein MotB